MWTRRAPLSLLALAVALAIAGCSVISVDLTPRIRPLQEQTVEGQGEAKILIMELGGVLSDEALPAVLSLGTRPERVPTLVRVREEIKKATEDKQVRAVVLRINSPGGTVTASDIIFHELDAFRRAAKVPIVAVMMDLAASGGYYVALAADTIVAHPTTVTGSIGTIMIGVNAQGLLDKLGLSPTTIKSAEHKDMGSPFRTLTPDERAIFQSVIDEMHRQFVAKVADRRRLPLEKAQALANGQVYTAPQALANGLIDRIGYMPDALEVARRAAGVREARVVVYHRPREYRATYYARAEASAGGLETTLAQFAALAGSGPRFFYLWWP
ncbi:MAG: signal peptide peptidase SppA [Candidatus Rokubacteria bacterium]|nr:signal peptide peptidase SppA [Candidatus Rokubacteria bacterium]MBI3824520.1 signal peptide peptidase SppA [Candidatus Rokubacteria bacterium]